MSEGNSKLKEVNKELEELFNKVNKICRENDFAHFSIVDNCMEVEEGGELNVTFAIPENCANLVTLYSLINDLFEKGDKLKLSAIAAIATGRVSVQVLNEIRPDKVKH